MRSYSKYILITSLFLPVATFASAQVAFTPIEQQFVASAVSELIVDAPNANITINTSNRLDIAVQVVVTGKNQERVNDYYESQYFDLTLEEGALQLLSEPDWIKLDRRSWRNPPTIDVDIAMPPTVYSQLRTHTGEVLVNELRAGAEIRTFNGKIAVDSISGGPIKLRSSDGHITAKELRGSSVTARTINGNIVANLLHSEDTEIRTSDGSITADKIHGTSVSARSINGSIEIGELTSKRDLLLQSSDGNITTKQIDAWALTAKAINGNVNLGRVSSDHAEIRTSDGLISVEEFQGSSVSARSINGSIKIRHITASTVLTLQSSDGGITTDQIDASSLTIKTINGPLNLGLVSGDHAEIRTSDGTINANKIQGESVLARSINGNIKVGEITSSKTLTLQSSDGRYPSDNPIRNDLFVMMN